MDPNFEPVPEASIPEPPSAPKPSILHRIFIGPFGLRAGWSLLIFILIVGGIGFGANRLQTHIKAKHAQQATATQSTLAPAAKAATPKPDTSKPQPLKPMIIGEGLVFTIFFLVSWLMAFIERRRVSAYGLGGGKVFLSRFLVGAFWGLAAQSLLILALHSAHLLVFDARLLHGRAVFQFGAAQLLAFLLVGFLEEYMFRGYLQFTLTRGMVCLGNLISREHARTIAFWIAAVITSGLFYAAHTTNAGENFVGLLSVFLAGITFLIALWRTGNLWWAIGFHMAWDWSQSFLYGVPDTGGLMQGRLFATHATGNPLYSGGTAGPEGSLLCLPILLLVLVVLFFTHPSPQPPLETLPHRHLEATDSQPPTGTEPLIA